MVSGLVLKPKTTNKGNAMTRPKRNDAVINVTKQDLMEMLMEDNAINGSSGMKLIFFGRFETHGCFGGNSSAASRKKVLLRRVDFLPS